MHSSSDSLLVNSGRQYLTLLFGDPRQSVSFSSEQILAQHDACSALPFLVSEVIAWSYLIYDFHLSLLSISDLKTFNSENVISLTHAKSLK